MKKFYKGNSDWQDDLNENFAAIEQSSKTYSELKSMVLANALTPGTQYVLTDYKTKYKQPDTLVIKEMAVERLVLTATSSNTFNTVCSSLDFPQDIVYYRFDLNKCEDDTTDRNGFITRRIDDSPGVCIDAPLDWRTILWARYLPNTSQYLVGTTLTNYSVWTSGAPSLNTLYKVGNAIYLARNTSVPVSATDPNVFIVVYEDITVGMLLSDLKVATNGSQVIKLQKSASYLEYLTFGSGCSNISIAGGGFVTGKTLPNNVFGTNCSRISFGSICQSNTFGASCSNVTFGSGCNSNTIMSASAFITFGSHCCANNFGKSNTTIAFGSDSQSNVFSGGCNNINFGVACSSNTFITCGCVTFDAFCSSNVFGDSCNWTTFGTDCNVNLFGTGCTHNLFSNSCDGNIFGTGCVSNTFGANCDTNTFGNSCGYNVFSGSNSNHIFGNNCGQNTFGANCMNNACGDGFGLNTFGSSCSINVFGSSCTGNSLCASIQGNTFGNNKCNLVIKHMGSKNISAVTALESRSYTTTIEKRNDGVWVYWSLNASNVPVYTTIA